MLFEDVVDEITGKMANRAFSIVKRSDLPERATILPSVWQMKTKRRFKRNHYPVKTALIRNQKLRHNHSVNAVITNIFFISILTRHCTRSILRHSLLVPCTCTLILVTHTLHTVFNCGIMSCAKGWYQAHLNVPC
jgi:hypothetical protein